MVFFRIPRVFVPLMRGFISTTDEQDVWGAAELGNEEDVLITMFQFKFLGILIPVLMKVIFAYPIELSRFTETPWGRWKNESERVGGK